MGTVDFVNAGIVGEVERHERRERAGGNPGLSQRGHDAVAIRQCKRDRGDRRLEIRHDDSPRELPCAIAHDRAQRRTIAQMQVPVVRADD